MSAPVIDILKKTDQLIIPSFHLSDYIESANQAAAEANEENAIHIITAEDALQASLTKISPTSASPDHVIKESITVDIQAPSETNYQEFYNTSDAPSKEVETTPIELPKEIISADEPKVSVSGEMISLSQIDDVIMEKMTTEEYEEYYRILCSQ